MTERKPAGVTFESWIDRQVREAEERGEFENLPGAGKPIPGLDAPSDEHWWLRQKMRAEGLSADALLPPSLQLRKEIEALPGEVRGLATEQMVRSLVAELNVRVAAWLRMPSGPWAPIGRVDADEVVRQWRADRLAAREAQDAQAPASRQPARRARRWPFSRRASS
ncbi:DUF1992 domain-containing protein [Solihabitans fulvus]|uniref:DUF1992 domain-containing protein n=1 Tax=Solihabitans fulvus TaxID=1892852 RepID=A0A5B2X4P1_9PSEU|nr:DUF1992 domain-containing protein [Solihabitans fulvus]KAA2258052.1 DUF1992 domain-containing protein [Solihabitans fulvus]